MGKCTKVKFNGLMPDVPFVYSGYVLTFDPTKHNSDYIFWTEFPSNDSTLSVTLRSFGGKLLFSNGSEVPVNFTEVIDGVTIYGYNRTGSTHTSSAASMKFKPTSTVKRVEAIKEDGTHLSIFMSNPNTGNKNYCSFDFVQTYMNHASIYTLEFDYCAVEIDLDKPSR